MNGLRVATLLTRNLNIFLQNCKNSIFGQIIYLWSSGDGLEVPHGTIYKNGPIHRTFSRN